jgi:hypothetical protein
VSRALGQSRLPPSPADVLYMFNSLAQRARGRVRHTETSGA